MTVSGQNRRTFRIRIVVAVMLGLLGHNLPVARAQGPVGEPTGPWREQIHLVPMAAGPGQTYLLYTRICRPRGDAPARVVVINHGAPPDIRVRPTMQPTPCENEAVQWFLNRGYLAVMGMRRGYGQTGGAWAESHGPACLAEGYAAAGKAGASDVDTLVNYATALPYARKNGVVVVGQSVGGWISDAYDSLPHPKVVAFVSMAGGHGGHHVNNLPNTNCRADELARAAGMFGAKAATPMLWVYTANDSFFAPEIATAMHAAFTAAGGKAELVQPGPYDTDGHRLFFGKGGSAIWGPVMERYLVSRQALP
jgi:dienelactone hydrolase